VVGHAARADLVTYYTVLVIDLAAQAPNANAYAERLVRSIEEECLDRIIPIGEAALRRALKEFVDRDRHERNHQVWATRSSTASIIGRPDDEFAVARGSVDWSNTTNGPH
jgi:hypothetical protein